MYSTTSVLTSVLYLLETFSQFTVCSVAVGKTSLITRFMYDSFDNTYQVRLNPEPVNIMVVWFLYYRRDDSVLWKINLIHATQIL